MCIDTHANEFTFMEGINMRLILSNFLVTAFSFYCLVLCIKGNVIHVAGIYTGIIVGLAGGIFTLINLGRRARKHEFTIVETQR